MPPVEKLGLFLLGLAVVVSVVTGLRSLYGGSSPKLDGRVEALTCPSAARPPTRSTWLSDRAALLCLINRERVRLGAPALREMRNLDHGANLFVARMVTRHFFSHTDPLTRRTFDQRFISTGYTSGAAVYSGGENLGWGGGTAGSPSSIVHAWMTSTLGHRELLVDRTFRDVGLSPAPGTPWGGAGGTYVVDLGYRWPRR